MQLASTMSGLIRFVTFFATASPFPAFQKPKHRSELKKSQAENVGRRKVDFKPPRILVSSPNHHTIWCPPTSCGRGKDLLINPAWESYELSYAGVDAAAYVYVYVLLEEPIPEQVLEKMHTDVRTTMKR